MTSSPKSVTIRLKNEMWYIMNADAGSKLITGFSQNTDQKWISTISQKWSDRKLLHYENVNSGDTFFIRTGTVHAIGAGILLAEIQQTSDVTYRIFDWNRKDKDGNTRELHTLALDAIDFSKRDDHKVKYDQKPNQRNAMVNSSYFKTDIIPLEGEVSINMDKLDSFVVLMAVDGDNEIIVDNNTYQLHLDQPFYYRLFEFIYDSGKPFKSIDDYHLASIILFSASAIIPQLFSITGVSNIIGHRGSDSVEKTLEPDVKVI